MNTKNTIMKSEEIRLVLEKYYNGESTLEEERFLKEFFSQAKIPDDLIDEKEIFIYYLQSVIVPEPSLAFENKIISAINSLDNGSENLKRRSVFGILTGIAAGMLILTGSYFFFVHKSEPRDTYSDPAIAYAETMKILYNVSSHLNRGTQALGQINQLQDETKKSLATINRSTAIIKERMKPVDNLLELIEKVNNGTKNKNK
jgi:hypothetical protein